MYPSNHVYPNIDILMPLNTLQPKKIQIQNDDNKVDPL